MEKDQLSGTDSIRIIEQMIGRAKEEEIDNGMGWVIWGWMLFLASIINYVMFMMDAPNKFIIWSIFGIGAVVFAIYSVFVRPFFFPREPKVKTYTNELVNRLGIAFFISLLVTAVGNYFSGANLTGTNFGYLLLLYGFWMFIHGSAFRFNLLKAGAFINWAGALIIFIWHKKLGIDILLVHAACVALGYIIPGHIAQHRFRMANRPIDNSTEL